MAMASSRTAQASTSLMRASAQPSTSSQRLFTTSTPRHAAPVPPRTLPTSHALAGTRPPRNPIEQVQSYPRHPLNAFFHFQETPLSATSKEKIAVPTTAVEGLDLSLRGEKDNSSRSWRASEMRRKSSLELHQLWYVCAMERNRLATKMAEYTRLEGASIAKGIAESVVRRAAKLRKSQGRIKLVLNERRLALIEAQDLARAQSDAAAKGSNSGERVPRLTAEEAQRQARQEAAYAALEEQAAAQEGEGEAAGRFSMGGEEGEGREGVKVGSAAEARSDGKRV